MVDKDVTEAAVGKGGTAERVNAGRSFEPASRGVVVDDSDEDQAAPSSFFFACMCWPLWGSSSCCRGLIESSAAASSGRMLPCSLPAKPDA